MTISNETYRHDYSGNGSTVLFTISFYFLKDAHIKAILYNVAADTETELTLTTHYTLTGAGDLNGGELTMVNAPTSDETLTILRNVDLKQETDYVEGSSFPADDHETALDKLTMLVQQLQEKINRSLKSAESQPGDWELPAPIAEYFLRWNEEGLDLESYALVDFDLYTVSAFVETLLDDLNASAFLTTLGLDTDLLTLDLPANTIISAFVKTLLNDADASAFLTTLGFSAFVKTLVDDADASTFLTTLGFSTFVKTLLDDTNASAFLTTLGFSAFMKTLIDDADAAAARATLDILLPMSEVYGCELSNNVADAEHDIDISAGRRLSDDYTTNMILASALTKQINAIWAEGTNQGGLDTGTVANSTEYHVYEIYNPTSDTTDVLFTITYGSPTMPTNYTKKRILGSIYTDGSAYILAFSQEGDEFLWDDPPLDVNVTNTGTDASTYTLSVATGRKVHALLNLQLWNDGTAFYYVSSLDQNDEVPSRTASPLSTIDLYTNDGDSGWVRVRTNTAGQIRGRADANISELGITTLGWIDRRGKDN